MKEIIKMRNELLVAMRSYINERVAENCRMENIPTSVDETFKLCQCLSTIQTVNKFEKVVEEKQYVAYTDGGYSRQKNVGAGAYVALEKGKIIFKGGEKTMNTTNNYAELLAVKCLIEKLPIGCKVEINSDSQYVIGVIGNPEWKPSKNVDMINSIKKLINDKGITVEFQWVKGHSGNKYNEMCDKMCNEIAGTNLNEEYEKYTKK